MMGGVYVGNGSTNVPNNRNPSHPLRSGNAERNNLSLKKVRTDVWDRVVVSRFSHYENIGKRGAGTATQN